MWQSESWLISLNCRLKLFILHFYVYEVWSKNNSYFIFFFKKYLFINTHLVSFKVTSLRYNTLMPAFFFQFSKHFWNTPFCIANSSCFDIRFIFSIVAKRFPFIDVFSFEKRKKSAVAKSSEYGGWGMITVLFLAKNSRTSIDVWAGALSCCKIHDWFFHNSVRFWRIA